MIAVILAMAVVLSVVKKLFKFAVILVAIVVLYIGYLYYTGEEIPKTADDLIENVSEKAEDAVQGLLGKSEDLKKKAKKIIKDTTP